MYVVVDCWLLEGVEAAGSNLQDVVLFPCQIINGGTDGGRGWMS